LRGFFVALRSKQRSPLFERYLSGKPVSHPSGRSPRACFSGSCSRGMFEGMFDFARCSHHGPVTDACDYDSSHAACQTGDNDMDQMLSRWQPATLSLFRFITGLLLFQFGVAKLFKFPELAYFANIPPLIQTAGWIELILGGLLMIGLFTRVIAFILAG